MKKSIIHFLLVGFISLAGARMASAQVIFQSQLVSQGIIQQNQLWNFITINNTGNPVSAYVRMTFQQEGGPVLFTGTTGSLMLPKEVGQFTSSNVGAIHYEYSPDYSGGSQNGGMLPIGRYIVCYTLITKIEGGGGQECVPLTVEPFSPPQLVFPEDKSVQSTAYPVMNWVPPMPVNMFSNLNYKLIISEVQEGQSPEIAIQRNPLLLVQDGITQNSFVYPSSYVALKEGKTYAWQVIAQNSKTYSQATEVWSFTIKKDTILASVDGESFPHLQRGAGSTLFGEIGRVKFSYDNQAGDSLVKVKVLQRNDGNETVLDSVSVHLKRGMNYINIDLGTIKGLIQNQEYVLELINRWKENWDLRFQYQLPIDQQ